MPTLRFNFPISCAASARSLSKTTSLRSISSILRRQSAISIQSSVFGRWSSANTLSPLMSLGSFLSLIYENLMESGADSRRPTADDLCYQFCHSLRFLAGILLDGVHNRGANGSAVCKPAHGRKVLRLRNSESYNDRQLGELANALDQFLRIVGQIFARASHAGSRHGVHESGGNLADSLQPLVGARWCREKNRREIVLPHVFKIFARFFDGQIGDERPIDSRVRRSRGKFLYAHPHDRIQVGEDNLPGITFATYLGGKL